MEPDNKTWPAPLRRRAIALRAQGFSNNEIGERMGVSRSAIGGLFHRLRKGFYDQPRKERERKTGAVLSHRKDIAPSKTPFAADDSCPDFAWDDDHCAAVNAGGGYPVLQVRRA